MFRYVLASLKFVFSAMFLEKPWSSKSFHFQCHNCHTRRLKVKCMDVVSEGRQQGGGTVVQPQGCQWVPLASDCPSASCHLPVDCVPRLTGFSFTDVCSVLCSLLCLSGFSSSRVPCLDCRHGLPAGAPLLYRHQSDISEVRLLLGLASA